MRSIFLKPGELYVEDRPAEVTTVLGSCVAVTMRHPASGLAAACHAVQPSCRRAGTCHPDCPTAARYVDCAMHHMMARFAQHHIAPAAIEVKLFGGAAILGNPAGQGASLSVGQLNISTAIRMAQALDLRLRVTQVGGALGRKIIFNTRTGVVWMKKIRSDDGLTAEMQETDDAQ